MKKSLLLFTTCFTIFVISGADRITFNWKAEAGVNKEFRITATEGSDNIIIDWNNGVVENYSGNGTYYITPSYTYSIDREYTVTVTGATENDFFLDIQFNTLSGLQSLDVSNCKKLISLSCDYNELTTLNASNCEALKSLYCNNNQLSILNISNCGALESLSCNFNQLDALDISTCKKLDFISCQNNLLTSLNTSYNSSLATLNCMSNQLTSLDISNNKALTSLNCMTNKLKSLDVSNNTALTSLNCSVNELSSLDVSKNTALTKLDCSANKLVSLNVSNNTALTSLSCGNADLSTLNISMLTNLTSLSCNYSSLTSLNISQNKSLESLECIENLLTILDISTLEGLTYLNCQNNQISTLDVSTCKKLDMLLCSHNNLSGLDLSESKELTWLNCSYNSIALDELYSIINNTATSDLFRLDISPQILPETTAIINEPVNIAAIDGNQSSISVRDASPDIDYTYENGILTFLKTGTYTVTMKNSKVIDLDEREASVIMNYVIKNESSPVSNNDTEVFSLHPNPVLNTLYINTLGIKSVEIFNMQGCRVIYQTGNTESINMSNLAPGSYIVIAHSDTKSLHQNIIKK